MLQPERLFTGRSIKQKYTSLYACCKYKLSSLFRLAAVQKMIKEVKSMKRILFFGDSLTAGYGLRASQAFPALIQERLKENGYQDYVVVNAGLSGDTTAGGVHRVDRWLNEPVDIFVLGLGANDGLRGIPTRETTQNLQQILDKVKHKHPEAKVILAGLEIPDIVPGRYAAEFRVLFRELSISNNISFIPFLLEGVAGVPHLNLPDRVHPNAEGQKILANHTWAVLKDLL